jgi:hypothetical protein
VFTHDEDKMTVRHFKLELLFQFLNGYLTAIFSEGKLSICILSGLSYAIFQTVISAILNVIIDGASIGRVIKYYYGIAFEKGKFTLVLYILLVLSFSLLGYGVYQLMVKVLG